jgi:hypothetical protein
MLAAHIGLAFEVVLTGHDGSMRWRGIGSRVCRRFQAVNEFIGSSPVAVHDGRHSLDGLGTDLA